MLSQGKPLDERIKETRMKYGLTQKQVSDLTGVPHRSIQNWEGGQSRCPEYVSKMVSDILHRKFGQPDYQTILEEVLEMMERDLKYLKTDEARKYVSNVINEIKGSIK